MSDIAGVLADHEAVGIRSGTEGPKSMGVNIGELATTCRTHKRFRGLRRPRNGCDVCIAIYEYAKKRGVKETRVRRKTYDEIVRENL